MSRTFWKPIGVNHTITASEESSGMARILVTNSAPASATDSFNFLIQVANSGTVKPNIKATYDQYSGVVNLESGTDNLALNDDISIIGMFYT